MPSTTPPPPEAPDPAVVSRRRAVALAGHVGDAPRALAGLADPAPAVRATALGALHRLGRLDVATWAAGLADASGEVRRRACELGAALAPGVGVAAVAPGLLARLGDPDPTVVEAACFALGELGPSEGPGTDDRGGPGGELGSVIPALADVATGHGDPLVREAAVAALGALGDPAGLAAILTATTDKPAVRRRAVLALAPFDGPEVDTALRVALADRDWQVRQAAEDLTGEVAPDR